MLFYVCTTIIIVRLLAIRCGFAAKAFSVCVGKNLSFDVWRPDFAFGYVVAVFASEESEMGWRLFVWGYEVCAGFLAKTVAVFASEEADLAWRRLFRIGSLRRVFSEDRSSA